MRLLNLALDAPFVDNPELYAGSRLDALISGDQLGSVFQPVVDLAAAQILGHEALGRCAPEAAAALGLAHDPASLLALAHAEGRLAALDRRWCELAIAGFSRFSPTPSGRLFVNVDPRAMTAGDDFSDFALDRCAFAGLTPQRVVLELTELGRTVGRHDLLAAVREARALGFGIALDDLGAGFASLAALAELRPDWIKLDRELVRGMAADPLRFQLVRALAGFASNSGVALVAEGIEAPADLAAAMRCGVRYAQGFLLGRPARRPQVLAEGPERFVRRLRSSVL